MVRVKLTVFILIFLATGCSKLLDMKPENSLTFANALETPRDFEAALQGAGQYLKDEVQREHIRQPIKGEYADDELPGGFPHRNLSPEYIEDGRWDQHYGIIAQANIVLHFADQADMTDAQKSLYKGQAYFYKALAYFELIRQYGDCVLVRDEVNIAPQAKTAWTEVADYAIELAQYAVDLLPEFDRVRYANGAAPTYKSAPAKGPANALLAHLCAWKAGGNYFAVDGDYDVASLWARAEAAATAVIESGSYSLAANPEQVVTSVLVGDDPESIYESVFRNLWHEMDPNLHSSSFTPARMYHNWPVRPNSSPNDHGAMYLRIFSDTVKAMFPGADSRKYAYFYDFEEMAKSEHLAVTNGYAYPYKWRDIFVATEGWQAGTMVNFNVNKIWWRLADIVLLRAECRARLGNDAGAIADINTIRTRATSPLYNSAEYNGNVRYAVFKEREKELLMEGHRYYDVIRNGYARTELAGGFRTATDQDFKDGAFFLIITISSFPGDFANNPLMRQNVYWSKYM